MYKQSSIPKLGNSDSLPSPFFSNPMCAKDLNIPIAIRKGVRTYAKYSLSNFLSFLRLNSNYKAFTTNFIKQNVSNALKDFRRKEAIFGEMRALHKNDTWDIVDLPK